MRVVLQLLSGQSHTAHLECDAAVSSLREHASEHSGIALERVRLAGDIVIGSDVSSGAPIKDLGVKESDWFMVLEDNTPPPLPDAEGRGPTLEEIRSITAEHYEEEDQTPVLPQSSEDEAMRRFRNLFDSLIQRHGGGGPDDMGEGRGVDAEDDEGEDDSVPEAQPELVQQLVEFGFPENRVRKALILQRNDPEAAIEWILEHSDDADIDEPLSEEQLRMVGRGGRAGTGASAPSSEEEVRTRVLEMGFTEQQFADALRHSGGDHVAAMNMMIGAEDTRESLFWRRIASDPTVRNALMNPVVYQAVQQIMRDPSQAPRFMRDPDIGPALRQLQGVFAQHMQ